MKINEIIITVGHLECFHKRERIGREEDDGGERVTLGDRSGNLHRLVHKARYADLVHTARVVPGRLVPRANLDTDCKVRAGRVLLIKLVHDLGETVRWPVHGADGPACERVDVQAGDAPLVPLLLDPDVALEGVHQQYVALANNDLCHCLKK